MNLKQALFFLLYYITVYCNFSSGATVERTAKELDTITLKCDVKSSMILWKKKALGRTLFVITNDQVTKNTPDERLSIERPSNLHIRQISKDDDGEYECEPIGNASISKIVVRLTVLVEPQAPQISYNSNKVLKAGGSVTLNCSTTGGNPVPQIQWRTNGRAVTTGVSYQPATEKYGVTWSTLTLNLNWTHHNQGYSCVVSSSALASGVTRTAYHTLEVLYAPRIKVGPFKPYKVEEGSAVRLNCSVSANPTPQKTAWYKDGQIVAAVGQWKIDKVSRADHGTYTCVSENTQGERSESVLLDVQYAPVVHVNQTVTVAETSPVTLSCQITSNPPPTVIRWLNEDGQEVSRATRSGQTSLSFTISSAHRDNAGNYKCEADNSLTPNTLGGAVDVKTGSAESKLVVHYIPSSSTILPFPDVTVGEPLLLTCEAHDRGVPEGKYEWRKVGTNELLAEAAQYHIPSVKLNDSGRYYCYVANSVGRGAAQYAKVQVKEPPQFLAPALSSEIKVPLGNTHFSVLCSAKGNPAPAISWTKDGKTIGAFNRFASIVTRKKLNKYTFNTTSSLRWLFPISEEDAGNYSCFANNRVTATGIQTQLRLHVKFGPKLVPEKSQDRVAVEVGDKALLRCHVRAYPKPEFKWFSNRGPIVGNTQTMQMQTIHLSSAEHLSTLSIDRVALDDLRSYRCDIKNDVGSIKHNVTLVVKTVPSKPKELTAGIVTWDSVLLKWKPGFNGGHNQSFRVDVLDIKTGNNWPVNVKPKDALAFNLTDLFPATRYTIRIRGWNAEGDGAYSDPVTITTKDIRLFTATDVWYDVSKHVLTFKTPSRTFCVKVDIQTTESSRWRTTDECASPENERILLSEDAFAVRVSLCLRERQDVCGLPQAAQRIEPLTEDVGAAWVILVAVVCGIVIFALCILLFIYVRRCQMKSSKCDYVNQSGSNDSDQQLRQMQPQQMPLYQPFHSNTSSLPPPSQFQTVSPMPVDLIDFQRSRNKDSYQTGSYGSDQELLAGGGSRSADTGTAESGFCESLGAPTVTDQRSQLTSEQSGQYLDPSFQAPFDRESTESGYSTPDKATKNAALTGAKKVIYEVIV